MLPEGLCHTTAALYRGWRRNSAQQGDGNDASGEGNCEQSLSDPSGNAGSNGRRSSEEEEGEEEEGEGSGEETKEEPRAGEITKQLCEGRKRFP